MLQQKLDTLLGGFQRLLVVIKWEDPNGFRIFFSGGGSTTNHFPTFFFHFRSLWTHVGASMRLRLLPLLLLAGPAFMLKPLHSLTTTLNLRPVTWPVPGSGWLEDVRVERKYVVYVI
jgi:hypothetical protein